MKHSFKVYLWLHLAFLVQQQGLCEVVISQIVEGATFNKAVVISNTGDAAVDMTGWSLDENVNVPDGSIIKRYTWPETTLAPSGSFMLCNAKASEFLLQRCDEVAAFGINGNDALLLYSDAGSVVDQFGDTTGATLTGSSWTISCQAQASVDNTLLRVLPPTSTASAAAAAVTSDDAWAASLESGWLVYPAGTFVDPANGTLWNAATGEQDPTRQPLPACNSSPSTDPPAGPTSPIGSSPSGDGCETPVAAADRRAGDGPRTLTIATYNTEFLFDGIGDPRSSRWFNDPDGAEAHVAAVASFISSWPQRADIINLAEVEDCASLASLAELLRAAASESAADSESASSESAAAAAAYTGFLLEGTDSATGQDVALLTTVDPSVALERSAAREDFPLPGSSCGFTGSGDTGVSKHYIARWESIDIGGEAVKLALVSLHLKAFPTDNRSCAQREAQALVARKQVQQLAAAGYEVVVLGDINDFSEEPKDAAGSEPTSRVLRILSGNLLEGDGVPGVEPSPRLRNAMEFLPQEERYTAWWDRDRDSIDDGVGGGENSAIDHVLLSEALWARVQAVDIVHEAPAGQRGDVLSDHWPIIVTLGGGEGGLAAADTGAARGGMCAAWGGAVAATAAAVGVAACA